jgi:hypothetical protein
LSGEDFFQIIGLGLWHRRVRTRFFARIITRRGDATVFLRTGHR